MEHLLIINGKDKDDFIQWFIIQDTS
jgi:hypothetical protein